MKEKLTQAKNEFIRQIRKLSIISTLTVHLLYIAYLGYSLMNDIGIKPVNIALMVGTAVFLIVYLFLQLFGENRKSKLKTTKKFYKKLVHIHKIIFSPYFSPPIYLSDFKMIFITNLIFFLSEVLLYY